MVRITVDPLVTEVTMGLVGREVGRVDGGVGVIVVSTDRVVGMTVDPLVTEVVRPTTLVNGVVGSVDDGTGVTVVKIDRVV